MSVHTLKDWVIATRPWSFPASTMPVAVTMAYCYYRSSAGMAGPITSDQWIYSVLALLSMILFQAAGNTWSDLHDFRHGVDTAADNFSVKILTSGQFSQREISTLSIVLFGLASSLGLILAFNCGIKILLLGLAGVALAVMYPFLKYNALGDADIFMTYALIPTAGVSYLMTGSYLPEATILSIPVGLITVAILHANNTRDVQTDRQAGIRTLAMIIGNRASRALYVAELVVPFVIIGTLIAAGMLPVAAGAACAVALLPAARNIRMIARATPGNYMQICDLDKHTAQLQLIFSMSLCLALSICAAFISFMA